MELLSVLSDTCLLPQSTKLTMQSQFTVNIWKCTDYFCFKVRPNQLSKFILITMIGQLTPPSKGITFKLGHCQPHSINTINNAHNITILFHFKQPTRQLTWFASKLTWQVQLNICCRKCGFTLTRLLNRLLALNYSQFTLQLSYLAS